MAWFKRKTQGILTARDEQNDFPEGQWAKCPTCGHILHRRALDDHAKVCPKCGYHFPMTSLEYFRLLFDEGRFVLHDQHLTSADPLGFVDRKPYTVRIEEARKQTGLNEAAQRATGTIGGYAVSAAALDFRFIGGSMGSVVGEIVARAIQTAYTERIPLLIISQSGGARMMEGILSLMQMAKTAALLTRLDEARVPYISLMSNPTTGGVTASFAMLGDINLAEPGALIGFAGPRVIRQTIGQDLPPGFQSAEFLREHGFIDDVVDRRQLRRYLIHLLDLLCEPAGLPLPKDTSTS
ncbi:acetyl-CoA carboxylase, carboxyltransferase subunit beta [Rhodothermus bifroesti]|uniref:Acetyl-coenzyme A carboxylase carboxyl transferase subunit beta n=1 Tax=Rhodothermus marinus TaxID=29549 RepID=A0A7V2AYT5_RHOMR|nr:acetyl-CoA carboxylase, carboxyltransferase subunit beta [Rhodothermus bifroesti]GBD00729.1 Acetyl-coenzyme A carboxylase carboxyl transferase subunit beta [bacterium HR18]